MNLRPTLIGAIIGDMIGSFYSSKDAAAIDFRNISNSITYTVDSVIIMEIASGLPPFNSYHDEVRRKVLTYFWVSSSRGGFEDQNYKYAKEFHRFQCKLKEIKDLDNYKFDGDTSILIRAIPIAFYFKEVDSMLAYAEFASGVTSNNQAEINATKAIALAIYLAYSGMDKRAIANELNARFHGVDISSFDLPFNPVELSIKAFMDSTDFESAIRNAISLGEDKYNLATLTGTLAAAHYNAVPDDVAYLVRNKMPYSFQYRELDFFRKLRSCDLIKVKEPPKYCPLCGSRVVYVHHGHKDGYPWDFILSGDFDMSNPMCPKIKPRPALLKDEQAQRTSIGIGCIISEGDPEWGCVGCEVKFISVEKYDKYMRMLFKL